MKLNVVVDMFGCPNRCMHCWLGHMPNRKMEEGADRFIMDYFDPFFDQISFYSWLREPPTEIQLPQDIVEDADCSTSSVFVLPSAKPPLFP